MWLLPLLLVAMSGLVNAQDKAAKPAPADTLRLPVVLETRNASVARTLTRALRLDGRTPYSISQLQRDLLDRLFTDGYLLATIDTVLQKSQPQPHLFVHIDEGEKPELAYLRVEIADSLRNLRSVRGLARAGRPLQLRAAIQRVVEELGDSGYPFARVQLDSVRLDAGEPAYGLTVRVLPGTQVTIDSIRISGNNVTRRSAIVRELPVRRGDLFRESLVEDIPQQLMRLGYFRSVAPPELYLGEAGRGLLDIRVEEGNANAFNGILGYNPATDFEPGYLTGLVDLKFGNLFGTGRQAEARWEKRGRSTQELALRYREPWLLGFPLHLDGGLQQLIQDTLYVDRRFDLAAEWPLLSRMYIVGRLESASISPDSSARGFIPKSSARSAGIGIRYDSRDDPINPRSGAFYATLLESIAKTTTAFDAAGTVLRANQQRLTVDANFFLPLWDLHVVSVGVHWRQLTSGQELNAFTDVFRFGGATTLRGYREEQFKGSRIAWANYEYRYLLSRRSRMFVFLDQGYFFRREGDVVIEGFRHGFGFGMRVETRLGIVGLDYGLGEGDSVLDGKVHVSLVNQF